MIAVNQSIASLVASLQNAYIYPKPESGNLLVLETESFLFIYKLVTEFRYSDKHLSIKNVFLRMSMFHVLRFLNS